MMASIDSKKQNIELLSHEVRLAIFSIQGDLDEWYYRAPAALDDLRHSIERKLRSLIRLTDDLIEHSRASDLTHALHHEQVDLQKVLYDSVELARPSATRRSQEIVVNTVEGIGVRDGDSDKILQVITALLQNASKFTPAFGTVTASLTSDIANAIITIEDNGKGIPRNQLVSFFDFDSQKESPNWEQNDGFGLGLKLVKSVIDAHGGSVTVDSEGIGRGTKFVVKLPLNNHSDISMSSCNSIQSSLSSEVRNIIINPQRILVVSDDQAVSDPIRRLLESLGHTVKISTTAQNAIQCASESQPQIILLDLKTRIADGFELARHLREQSRFPYMVIIAFGGCDSEEYRIRAKEAGVEVFLRLPTDLHSIHDAITAASSGHDLSLGKVQY